MYAVGDAQTHMSPVGDEKRSSGTQWGTHMSPVGDGGGEEELWQWGTSVTRP